MKLRELFKESATEGTTNAAMVGIGVVASHKGGKSYTGTPGKSGTKAPKQLKPKMQDPEDNALDKKGGNLLGGTGLVKR